MMSTLFSFRNLLTLLALFVTLSITTSAQVANATGAVRIKFARGTLSAQVRGQLKTGQNEMNYVVGASKGQHMIVNIAPGAGPEFANSGTVTSPSGATDGGKGGIIFDATLTESGDYRIRIARNLMATEGKPAGYVLEVIVF